MEILKQIESKNKAIRVINILPTWQPGRQSGNPVNVWYTLQVQFKLLK